MSLKWGTPTLVSAREVLIFEVLEGRRSGHLKRLQDSDRQDGGHLVEMVSDAQPILPARR